MVSTTTTGTKATKATRAVVYLRVSTDEQAASGLGLEAQEAACRAYCAAHGYAVGSVHADEGVSGSTPVDRRPALTEALGALTRGAVLVAAKRDRLARELHVAAVLEQTARKAGASVETPDAPSSDDPFAVALRGMLDVFAQLERAQIAARTKAALAAKRARGEKTGGALPFGRTLAEDGRTLAADPREAEALGLIRALRSEGLTLRAIVDRLNAQGVPARGARWHLTTVATLCKREAA
jgi:DNA invertase Pin-like site-specific DNA recombinase